MGEVFRARDTRLDRTVAIKVLPERVAADADARAGFEHGAGLEACRRIVCLQPRHPTIEILWEMVSMDLPELVPQID